MSPAQLTGELRMRLAARAGRTYVSSQYHCGALTLLRPLYLDAAGQAVVTIINPGGGYLSGDRYTQEVEVEPGADAVITSQSATRVYRTTGRAASAHTLLRVGAGATLAWLPDELIAYEDAAFEQHILAEIHPEATLITKDILTPGWSPSGQPHRYRSLHASVDVRAPHEHGGERIDGDGRLDGAEHEAGAGAGHEHGRLLARDNLVLMPAQQRVGGPGSTGGAGGVGDLWAPSASHIGSLLVVSPKANPDTIAAIRNRLATSESEHEHLRTGVSALPTPGFLVRALGRSTGAVGAALDDVIDYCRAQWFDQPPLRLRKY